MHTTSVAATPIKQYPLMLRFFMPTVTDMIFFVLFYMLTYGAWASALLNDADTGWHIRNGEYIRKTFSVPQVDYFSYTMSGQPWYAWEWLYDIIISYVHSFWGLNGVAAVSALIVALTFTLLFRVALARGATLFLAAGFVVLSASASTIHLLARPHIMTWLFTVIWFYVLDRFQRRRGRILYWLPPLMLLWVNIHGGFLIGFLLLGIYFIGNLWSRFTAADAEARAQAGHLARSLAMALLLCLAVTLATPYGYRLHVHIYKYLTNRYLMDHIVEFMAPNFHMAAEKYFEMILMAAFLALAFSSGKLTAIDILMILFGVHATLFAARNLPVSCIMLTLTISPLLTRTLRWGSTNTELAAWVRGVFSFIDGFSGRMGIVEGRLKSHFLPIALVGLTVCLLMNNGEVFYTKILKAKFDDKQFPVKAAEFIAAQDIRDHLFTTDTWGAYLLYRLHPRFRVFMDDRHDFYQEAFLKEYIKAASVAFGWKTVLIRHQVAWVLASPDSALSNALKEMTDWKVTYDDGVAIVFKRVARADH
ncbi:MAG: hypothetical protein HYR55_12785 [Acidobacteria bacterium]|nr:hypothetical protein [Acidobacteriota bacterium]MBI3657436.1 hypothetical protein [Acidobacteriota bacterium]